MANDSKIPTTVPNKPTNGAVEEIIESQEIPKLASFIIDISQAFNICFEVEPFEHLYKEDSGFTVVFRDVKDSSDFFSFTINEFNERSLYIKIQKTVTK